MSMGRTSSKEQPPASNVALTVDRDDLDLMLERVEQVQRALVGEGGAQRPPSISEVSDLIGWITRRGRCGATTMPRGMPALRRALVEHLYEGVASSSATDPAVLSPTKRGRAEGGPVVPEHTENTEQTHPPVDPTCSTGDLLAAMPTMLRCIRDGMPDPDTVSALTPREASKPLACVRRLSKRQCFAVLCAGFFCFFERETNDGFGVDDLPSINFDEMHVARVHPRENSVEVAKLRMFLDYFVAMSRRESQQPNSGGKDASSTPPALPASTDVVFIRVKAPRPHEIAARLEQTPLVPFVMRELGESIDDERTALRADFANAVIGGASLSFGCVQEEIMFSICPEMNVSRVFCPPMREDEAILIFRAEQFSVVRPGTYAFSLQYGGPFDGASFVATSAVAAIDALDFRGGGSRRAQYTKNAIAREVTKAVAGFCIDPALLPDGLAIPVTIATGNWGCGAFLGDPSLKLLQQWLACSFAGRPLHYFPFDQRKLVRDFEGVYEALGAAGVLQSPKGAGVILRALMSPGMANGMPFGVLLDSLSQEDAGEGEERSG